MKNFNKLAPLALALGFAAGAAQALTIDSGLLTGLNTLQDESRETYVDANNDGKFGVGDVIFGYIRISDFQQTGPGISAANQVYGVFSQEIAGGYADITGTYVIFKATTVAGLRLKDLLGGDANVGTNAVAAFYDRPTAYTDLIISEPPTAPTSMPGYLDYIRNNGTLRVVAGIGSDGDDFLISQISGVAIRMGLAVDGSNTAILGARVSDTLAYNTGALSILFENTDWSFNEQGTLNPITNSAADGDVLISSGTTAGAGLTGTFVSPATQNWKEAGGAFQQCKTATGGDERCGFTNKNDFTVDVYKTPEPGSLGLFSAALLGLAGLIRRRKS